MKLLFLKNNLWIIFAIITIVFCLAIGIIKSNSDLPWFDEVYFADITHSVLQDNTLTLNVLLSPEKALIYGPVYFYTQKVVLSFLGFGMWQFRILNIAAGILLLIIFWIIAKKLNISKLNICILIALIAFDSRFIFNMASGRMDLLALALFMIGWFLFQNNINRTFFLIFIAGIISSISFLTTPRIGFYFLVYILTFVIEYITSDKRNKILIQYLVFGFLVLVPILIWIYSTYGSIFNYSSFFFNDPLIANHYGGSIFPVKYQIPIIVLWFISGVYVFRSRKNILNPFLIALFFFPVFHLIFIKEVGPYSAMMMPFIYFGIIISVNSIPKKEFSILPGIFVLYLFLFSLSSTFNNIASREFTNSDPFRTFLKSKNITNRNVLADFPYYYLLTENGNRFISFYNTKDELTENNLNNINIEYAIISNENYIKNGELFRKLGFVVMAEYHSKKGEDFFYKIARYLKKNNRTGYDGFILKR